MAKHRAAGRGHGAGGHCGFSLTCVRIPGSSRVDSSCTALFYLRIRRGYQEAFMLDDLLLLPEFDFLSRGALHFALSRCVPRS